VSGFNLLADSSLPLVAILWAAAAVAVGLICGFILGSTYIRFRDPRQVQKQKAKVLESLIQVLQSTEQLNADVNSHNSELAIVRRNVGDINATGDLNEIQKQLVDQIQQMVESNRKLETDLCETQFELQKHAQELDVTRREARIDNLSGLFNRRAFDESLMFFLSIFRARGETFGLIMADLDHFKRINDSYGHAAGDLVVQKIGEVLKLCVRGEDVVARIGGDEFAILLKGVGGPECRRIAARIRQSIERTNFGIGDDMSKTSVTVSLGIAVVRPDDTAQTLSERADRALYRSKQIGRNSVHSCEADETLVSVTS
jgi:diguanylate cyclase